MTLPVYPALSCLSWPIKWSPQFFNMKTQTTGQGADIDLALAQYPLHDFELTYNVARNDATNHEFQSLIGFVGRIGGTAGRFLFSHPEDNTVVTQLVGVGDGSTTAFILPRTFGNGSNIFTEPVGYVDLTATFHVYVDSVLKTITTDYTVDQSVPGAQVLNMVVAPPNGKNVTVDMTYLYYCKFADNKQEFQRFMSLLWDYKKALLHTCRAGA